MVLGKPLASAWSRTLGAGIAGTVAVTHGSARVHLAHPSDLRMHFRLHTDVMTTSKTPAADPALMDEVAALMVTALNLEMAPQDIDPDEPLYGDGLGLDSIDILEVALAVSKKYGFQLRADDENNAVIYASLRNLSQHIAEHRAQ